MMKWVHSILMAVVLAGGGYSATVLADTDEMQTSAGFRYATSRTATVSITLALPDHQPALLSFYSEGANGLRLLENAFTDERGRYAGKLRLPAHLNQVVMVVRATERQDTFTLPVNASAITYAD